MLQQYCTKAHQINKQEKNLLTSKYVKVASTQSPGIRVPPRIFHGFGILGHFARFYIKDSPLVQSKRGKGFHVQAFVGTIRIKFM